MRLTRKKLLHSSAADEKVMHGDRIVAVIHTEKERESAEPEELIEPFLTRFVGKVQGKNDRLSIVPDHPLLKDAIPCRAARAFSMSSKKVTGRLPKCAAIRLKATVRFTPI